MRILGLDYGEKTIGVAVSDMLLLTANPVTVIKRKANEGLKSSIREIARLAADYEIEKIVLGYPKNMNNTIGERALETEKFGKKLQKELRLPIVYWDERLSSISAEKIMLEADLSRKKRKEHIDRAAAAVILQNYLDYERNNKHKKKGENKMDNEQDGLMQDGIMQDGLLNEEETEEVDVIVLTDDETGEDIELVIVDSAETDSCTYLLVIDSEEYEDEELNASIIKETQDDMGEFVYEIVEDEAEFEEASKLFMDNEEFDIV